MGGEWRTYRLGQLGRIVTGRTPPGTRPDSFGGSMPFLTPTDMDGRRKVESTARSLSAKGANLLKGSVIPHGVAVSCIGWQMGKTLLVDRPVITNQQINSIITSSGLVDDLFLFYALRARRQQFFALGAGGTRTPILKKSEFAQVKVPLPCFEEQRTIAHILGTLDDKIELNRRMSETLEAMARALFKSWFVDFDPVRAKMDGRWRPGQSLPGLPAHLYDLFPDRLVESELGEIPEGWEVGTVEDLGDLSRESVKPGDHPEEVFHHYSIPAYDEGRMPRDEAGSEIKSNKYLVLPGSVLLSKLNPRIPRVWLPSEAPSRRAICSTEFLVVCPRIGRNRAFLYSLLTSSSFSFRFATLVTGTSGSHQRVKPLAFRRMAIVRPSVTAADRFGAEASVLLGRVESLRQESRILAALRDTLLPKLVSGELRVNEASKLMENAR